MPRVAVIGWDCAPPAIVFERWRNELPHVDALMTSGLWGELRSCHPPITVPAWAVMTTGKDAGELGLYGFRNRQAFDYGEYRIASSSSIREDAVWDVLAAAGKRSILLGVPPSYPPRPIDGWLVSCFLTPSTASCFTHPTQLSEEVHRVAGGYVFDADDFRSTTPQRLLEQIADKTRKHFKVAKHLLRTKPWDFFMMVEMGPDRVHHALWRFIDPSHPSYEPESDIECRILQYYRDLDRELGEVLDILGDETIVLLVSDHGARRTVGTVRFNEWLIERGHLRLSHTPEQVVSPDADLIDWTRTRAWGEGGYYGRLFMNVRGREPGGRIEPTDYERVRDDLIAEIGGIEVGAQAYRPEDLYRTVRGLPPDLLVYFGDLGWRSLGTVGWGQTIAPGEAGADGANHDWDGIFVMRHPQACRRGHVENLDLLDIAPTILAAADVSIPRDMRGRPIGMAPMGSSASPALTH
jgi:predicted AlkP superfamily phosphohydrolase/phosphomutase